MASRKNVPASTVRAWFNEAQPEGVPAPGSRGRLHPDTIAAFMKANPRLTYVTASDAEKPTITVPVTGLDKAGRRTTRQVTLTTEAARAALGHPSGKRGRFNKADLSDVLSQEQAALVADQFV